VLFQPPRSELSIFVGDDLETLYLEEIDVSDSHDHNSNISSKERNSSTTAANRHGSNDVEQSVHSRQTSLNRTNRPIRIFPPQNVSSTFECRSASIDVSMHLQQSGISQKKYGNTIICMFLSTLGHANVISLISVPAAQKASNVASDMPHRSISPRHLEHYASPVKSNPWNANDFSANDNWKSQQVDAIEDNDSALSSVQANVDSSDDDGEMYNYDSPNVWAGSLQENEMTPAPK
jgi:hypothetical protein